MAELGQQCAICTAVWATLGLSRDRQEPGDREEVGAPGSASAWISEAQGKWLSWGGSKTPLPTPEKGYLPSGPGSQREVQARGTVTVMLWSHLLASVEGNAERRGKHGETGVRVQRLLPSSADLSCDLWSLFISL